jgi:hypothetical protein
MKNRHPVFSRKENTSRSHFRTEGWALSLVFFCATTAFANFFDDVLNDMTLTNEAILYNAPSDNVGWTIKGNVTMGNAARGDATPVWWQPTNTIYKSSSPWNVITPWFVIYPGVGHDPSVATNYRVKISKMKLYILRKSTQRWEAVNTDAGTPRWSKNMAFYLKNSTVTGNGEAQTDPADGSVSYVLDAESHPIHGGLAKMPIDGTDVAAVYGHLTSQLILDDPHGPDNRDLVQVLVSMGADYYPKTTTQISDFDPMGYVPASAKSRFTLVGPNPRMHYMATIDPPGAQDTGSTYQQNGGVSTLSFQQFKENPPPELTISRPKSLKAK